jgi:hypothetical protein
MNARCYECQRPLTEDEDVCPLHPGAGVLQEFLYFDLNDPATVEALRRHGDFPDVEHNDSVDDDPPC